MNSVNVSRRAVLTGLTSLAIMGCGCTKKSDKSDDSKKKKKSEKSEDEAFSFGGIGDTSSSDASRGLTVDGATRGRQRTLGARSIDSCSSA